MILRTETVERTGPAIDARDLAIDPETILAAIADHDDDLVSCPTPGPVHRHVRRIDPSTTITRETTVLAAAARSRGETTEFDDQIDAVSAEISAIDLPTADVPAAVRAVNDAEREVDAHRDRVARLGGIVAARDEPDAVSDAQSELRTAAAELAAAETDHHAARQELARERDRQRAANDARERRLRLQDRLENLRRDARQELADREGGRIDRALDAIPRWPDAIPDSRLALAVVRTASIRSPVVIVDGPFRTSVHARACLAAPVILASD